MIRTSLIACACALAIFSQAYAHDTWVQVNTGQLPVGEVAFIDLMLGNHGNRHRDFRLNSKIRLEPCEWFVLDPAGNTIDLKPAAIDRGLNEKDGFWTCRYLPETPGVHVVGHTLDLLHGATRAIKSSKAYLRAGEGSSSDSSLPRSLQPLGHPLELVPLNDPSLLKKGEEISLQVLYRQQPLVDAEVSLIPCGQTLEGEFDSRYERKTDAKGIVRYTFPEGNIYLVVVHHLEPEQSGENFDKTHYGATLTLRVRETSR